MKTAIYSDEKGTKRLSEKTLALSPCLAENSQIRQRTVPRLTYALQADKLAIKRIKEIVAEPEVGEIYEGVVSGIKEFGLFVKILKNFESMVHISEITGERLKKIEDAKIKEGDKVFVRYLGADKRGKTRMSMVGIDQKTGKETK